MEALKFTIEGLGGSFTRPSFNSVVSTYSHIHKISILGVLGAIIGISNADYKKGTLPKFYKELNDLKISIVPHNTMFFKKKVVIMGSNGFLNKESNFVGNYDTLLNPKWDIYLVNESNNPNYEKIKHNLLNNESYFCPYLGRNHWFASISNVEVLDANIVNNATHIDGLFLNKDIDTEEFDDFEEEEIYFEEYMPTSFMDEIIQYNEEKFVLTNREVANTKVPLLQCDNKTLYMI